MDLCPLRRDCVTRQHHLVLPAVEPTDTGIRPFVNLQTRRVAFAPHRALGVGRLELAVTAQDLALASDEQKRAVHGAARSGVEFGDTDNNIYTGSARCFGTYRDAGA